MTKVLFPGVDHMLDSNLYVNPLDGGGRVKKSASGDTALRSLGVSPMDETYIGFGATVRGSRGSLNDSPVPKHRKARFQVCVSTYRQHG